MTEHLDVDPALLANASEGINKVVGELKGLGIEQSGAVGRGFSLLNLTGLQAGTAELHDAMDGFCDRWEWGVRSIVQDANTIAQNLGLAAGLYHDMEEYASSRFKRLVADGVADPRQSDEQTDQQSWGEVMSSPIDGLRPDYSVASSVQADEALKAAGASIAHDVAHSANPAFGVLDPTEILGD